jgi:hypothetical protein
MKNALLGDVRAEVPTRHLEIGQDGVDLPRLIAGPVHLQRGIGDGEVGIAGATLGWFDLEHLGVEVH